MNEIIVNITRKRLELINSKMYVLDIALNATVVCVWTPKVIMLNPDNVF